MTSSLHFEEICYDRAGSGEKFNKNPIFKWSG